MKATSAELLRRARKPVLVTTVTALGLALGVGGALVLWRDKGDGSAKPVPSAKSIHLPRSVAHPGPRPITGDPAPVPAVEPATAA